MTPLEIIPPPLPNVLNRKLGQDGHADNHYSPKVRNQAFHDQPSRTLSTSTLFAAVPHIPHVPKAHIPALDPPGANASEPPDALNMPGSSSNTGAPPQGAPSRQRPSQPTASARRPQPTSRSSFQQTPPTPVFQQRISPPHQQENSQTPSNPVSNFYRNPSPHYQPHSPYMQHPGYPGHHYSGNPQQQPMMIHSPSHYPFPHLPTATSPDSSVPSMAYSQPSMLHMLPQHGQIYPYSAPSPDTNQSQHTYGTGAGAPNMSMYSQPLDPSSSAPHSPLSPGQGSNPPPLNRQGSFVGQTGYQHMGYSTTGPAYAPPLFGTAQSMYSSPYPTPYSQSYAASAEQEASGAWWYLPPGATGSMPYENMQGSFPSPYGMSYQPQNLRDSEGAAGSPSVFPTSPSASRPSPSFGGPAGNHGREPPFARSVAAPQGPPLPSPAEQPQPPGPTAPVGDVRPHPGRKPYHPNPPAQRSEWVMWAGNVPSDATQDELWRFFSQQTVPGRRPPPESTSAANTDSIYGGVSSIFLISRSNCAFVNFESERHLEAATVRFNGQPLRPADPRCPRLVCRIRRRTDDLRAGVGGQRGQGIHSKWVRDHKEQLRQTQDAESDPSLSPEEAAAKLQSLALDNDESPTAPGGPKHNTTGTGHSSSGSTTSSMLVRYFPQRYFILKSLTQFDLDLSVQQGLWATQRHNEGILDQAFRTSKDVFLIFGVNKSGEFYGYARMAGPISRGEHRVSWASPPASLSPSSVISQRPQMFSGMSDELHNRRSESGYILPPTDEHRVDESPLPVSSSQDKPSLALGAEQRTPLTTSQQGQILSAPAELRDPHRKLTSTGKKPQPGLSLDVRKSPPIELDEAAPIRALKNPPSDDILEEVGASQHSEPLLQRSSLGRVEEEDDDGDGKERRTTSPSKPTQNRPGDDSPASPSASHAEPFATSASANHPTTPDQDPDVWGEPFKIEWIRTDRLPFFRTRHLRNPWNHGREVKVSRDGTEIEPGVGKELLEEWERPPPSPDSSAPPTIPATRPQRRGSRPPFFHPP